MEIIDKNPKYELAQRRHENKLYIGIVIALTGIMWLLYHFDIISYALFKTIFSWPVFLAVCGGYLLSLRRWYAGSIAIVGGVVFFAIRTLNLHVSIEVGWGILLIIAGVALIVSGIRKH